MHVFWLHGVQIYFIQHINHRKQETLERVKPRVATRSPSTSSGVMCPLCVRRSSSVTGLLSTWLLRDLSLFRTPPPGLRSRGGAAVLCPPPETFSATGASLRALAPLIVDSLPDSPSASSPVSSVFLADKFLQEEDGVVDVECREKCR